MMGYPFMLHAYTIWLRWTDTGDRPRYEVTVENHNSQFGKAVEFPDEGSGWRFATDLEVMLGIPVKKGYTG